MTSSLEAGTVTYDISSISSPGVHPDSTTPQVFARSGSGSGYSYYTMGLAYLSEIDGATNVSSWTHVDVDLSSLSRQTLESAWLQLRVRDGVGPQDLSVWADDGSPSTDLASTRNGAAGIKLAQGTNIVDLTNLLEARLDSGQKSLGLWFYNFSTSYTPAVALAALTRSESPGDGSTTSFYITSRAPVAVPLPSSAVGGLCLLVVIGCSKHLHRRSKSSSI